MKAGTLLIATGSLFLLAVITLNEMLGDIQLLKSTDGILWAILYLIGVGIVFFGICLLLGKRKMSNIEATYVINRNLTGEQRKELMRRVHTGDSDGVAMQYAEWTEGEGGKARLTTESYSIEYYDPSLKVVRTVHILEEVSPTHAEWLTAQGFEVVEAK